MKALKSTNLKRSNKQDRQYKALLGLVDHYVKTGKPVGSHTLQESGFHDLSTATLRNYFARLEEEGYLIQLHASGGRIPTDLAYRLYAAEYKDETTISPEDENYLQALKIRDTKEVTTYLSHAAEILSGMTRMAAFLSAPRFDHDFILDVKLFQIDIARCLCILITDFGVIKTEVLHTDHKLSSFSLKRMEGYFLWRLKGQEKPADLSDDEEKLARNFYNEVMVRYIVGYSHFTDEEVYRVGLSELLNYPDFTDAAALANSLSIFENIHSMRLLLRECSKTNTMKYWIGSDLAHYSSNQPNCTVLAVPYRINQQPVGAFALLGPLRLPYRELFGILSLFSDYVSEALTRSIYKFKITYREPERGNPLIEREERILLEDQSQG